MSAEPKTLTNQLESLRRHSVIVADSGDIEAIAAYRPQDATTNPSLIFKAAQEPRYARLVDAAIAATPGHGHDEQRLAAIIDRLMVVFGQEILKLVPGRVSTEVEARLSFDTAASERKARHLIELYEAAGVPEYWIVEGRVHRSGIELLSRSASGQYEPVQPDEEGRLHSRVLPGFWLKETWLAADPLPDPLRALRRIAPDPIEALLQGSDATTAPKEEKKEDKQQSEASEPKASEQKSDNAKAAEDSKKGN